MDSDHHTTKGIRSVLPWLFWLGGGAVLIGLLSWKLSARIHPWELALTISGGFEEKGYSGVGTSPTRILSISPDQKHLVTARPGGTCEIWNLESLEKVATFAKPVTEYLRDKEHAALDGARQLQHTDDGRILIEHDGDWLLFDSGGSPLREFEGGGWTDALEISGDGTRIANADHRPSCYFTETAENVPLFGPYGLNGGRQRFQWFADDRHVLFNDAAMVGVVDTDSKQWRFQHGQLDVRLPMPMFAGEDAEWQEMRKWSAHLMDSQLGEGESKIVSIYDSADFGFDGGNPEANRLRSYDVLTGELLSDEVLPSEPRSLEISRDGSLAYVLMCPNFTNRLRVYDTESMEQVREISYKHGHRFPPSITPFPDNSAFVNYRDETWIFDLEEKWAPVKLHDWPSNVVQVEVADDSQTIVVGQINKNVHVWKNRRQPSRWGALVLWEYQLVYAVGIMAVCGLALQLGRREQRQIGRKFPRLLWVAILVLGVGLGESLVELVIDPVVGNIYEPDYRRSGFQLALRIFGCALGLMILTGLVQLRNGWRKCYLVVSALSIILVVGLLIYAANLLSKLPEIPASMPFIFDSGFKIDVNPQLATFVIIPGFVLVSLIFWWIIFRKSTREFFESAGSKEQR